jgi:hypothetical protein
MPVKQPLGIILRDFLGAILRILSSLGGGFGDRARNGATVVGILKRRAASAAGVSHVRFGRKTRVFASCTFLVTRVLPMGTRLYVSAGGR